MPVHAVPDTEPRRVRLQGRARGAFAEHAGRPRQVAQPCQRLQEHVRPLLVAEPSNPAYAETIVVPPHGPAGRRPIEWRLGGPPRVWHPVETLGGAPTPPQLLGQGA